MVEEVNHSLSIGLGCFFILAVISGLGLWLENSLHIGFRIAGMYVTFIPFLIGVVIDFLIIKKLKREGSFIKGKFWIGFFMIFLVGLLAFGACWIIIGANAVGKLLIP